MCSCTYACTQVDGDGSGQICEDEFIEMVRDLLKISERALPVHRLRALWQALDTDGSGQLSSGEFGAFMRLAAGAPVVSTPATRFVTSRAPTPPKSPPGHFRPAITNGPTSYAGAPHQPVVAHVHHETIAEAATNQHEPPSSVGTGDITLPLAPRSLDDDDAANVGDPVQLASSHVRTWRLAPAEEGGSARRTAEELMDAVRRQNEHVSTLKAELAQEEAEAARLQAELLTLLMTSA